MRAAKTARTGPSTEVNGGAHPGYAGRRMFNLEHRLEPLLPREVFFWRMARWFAIAAAIILGSLVVGVCGYHFLEGLPWIDSLLNASMILGGMGPVDPIKTEAGKLFASFYALYSGLAIISIAGLLLTPVLHRVMHKFHIDAARK